MEFKYGNPLLKWFNKNQSKNVPSPSDVFGYANMEDKSEGLVSDRPSLVDTPEKQAFLDSQNGKFKYPWKGTDSPIKGIPQAVHMLDNIWGFDPRRMSAGVPAVFEKNQSSDGGASFGESDFPFKQLVGQGDWNVGRLGQIGSPKDPLNNLGALGHEFVHQASSTLPYISGSSIERGDSGRSAHPWDLFNNANKYPQFLIDKGYIKDPLTMGQGFSRSSFQPQTMYNDFSKQVSSGLPGVRPGIANSYANMISGAMTDPVSLDNTAGRLGAYNMLNAAQNNNILSAESTNYWYNPEEMMGRNVSDYTRYWTDPDYDLNNYVTGSLSDNQYDLVDDYMLEMGQGY